MKFFSILFLMIVISSAKEPYTVIGNPYTKQYKKGEDIYARNIWDMQLYKDKIYMGAGNSSNRGPAQNAGRVYVVSLNPKTDTFNYEYKVAEEQIDILKVYADTLYIPGHDATQKWDYGNIYTFKEKWKKYRTLPKALHVYDVVVKNNQIFTAIGLRGKGAVFVSDMDAKDWKQISHGKGRVYGFLEVEDELFATKTFRKKYPQKLNMTQWLQKQQTFSSRFDLNIKSMFPQTKLNNGSVKIVKSTRTDGGTIYLGGYKHNDHQTKPFGVYFIDKNLLVKKIKIEKGQIPRDVIVRNSTLFLLSNNNNEVLVSTIDTKNLSTKKYISFRYPTFARSFEEYNGCFYFGMGSDLKRSKKWEQKELKKETGDIVKVCQEL